MIDVVVEPVVVEEVRVRAPAVDRALRRIVGRVIVFRNRNLESFFKVPAILRVEREEVVFGMAGHENLPPAFRGKQAGTGAAARSKHSQGGNCGKIL